jgi:dipeptidyl aminopeptidase/acylaminoacyl peptidase
VSPTPGPPNLIITETKSIKTFLPTNLPDHNPTITSISTITNQISTPVPFKTLPVPSATSVKPGATVKKILLLVSEDLKSAFSKDSIWIQSLDDNIPHVLIRDQAKSFESPRWSHDGQWIAFVQKEWPNMSRSQVGIVRADGSGKQVFTEKFSAVGNLNWSANDTRLIFDTISSPVVLNIDNGEIVNLLPDSDNSELDTRLMPSPIDDLVADARFTRNPGTEVDLRLLSFDGKAQENIQLPTEIPIKCRQGLTTLEWSPDGEAILMQFWAWPWEECKPYLWLYNLSEKKWINIATLPDSMSNYYYDYNETGQVNWSTDGRWIAWATPSTIVIYSVDNDWGVVRKIDLGISDSPLFFPWVEDTNGNYIYSLNRADITNDLRIPITILGISPNGTTSDDRKLLRIEANPNWLPNNSYFIPIVWEP